MDLERRKTNAEYQSKRTTDLNKVAISNGWKSWSEYETAVLHKNVKIACKPSTNS